MTMSASDREVDRRSLLRRGGVAVAAGVAGAAAGQLVSASAAEADPGSPLLLDEVNDGGSATTSLTAAIDAAPTLEVANNGLGASLRVTSSPIPDTADGLDIGDLATFDGNLYYTADAGGPYTSFVYTPWTASQVAPIRPQRILDTRTKAGRAHIANAAGNLDSAGHLLAGRTILIRLSTLVVAPQAAFCNLTVVRPGASGYANLWPGGTRPATSTVNFAANAVVANFAVTGVNYSNDTVAIYANRTTHVLLDITAFAVGSYGQINPDILAAPASAATEAARAATARARTGAVPHWYREPLG